MSKSDIYRNILFLKAQRGKLKVFTEQLKCALYYDADAIFILIFISTRFGLQNYYLSHFLMFYTVKHIT